MELDTYKVTSVAYLSYAFDHFNLARHMQCTQSYQWKIHYSYFSHSYSFIIWHLRANLTCPCPYNA